MRHSILLLSFVCSASTMLLGETLNFTKFNFSLESPESWHAADPPPAETLGLIRSEDGMKGVVIMASRFAGNQLGTALDQMVGGAKESAASQGIKIQHESMASIDGLTFRVFTTKAPTGASIISYMALSGNIGYSIQGFSNTTDAGTDDEILAIIGSFKLLAKPGLSVATTTSQGEAYEFGKLMGQIAVIAFILGGIWIMISKARKK